METFYIIEAQNLHSQREFTHTYTGSLRGAKIAATKGQIWAGTCLIIKDNFENRVAYKEQYATRWTDEAYYE